MNGAVITLENEGARAEIHAHGAHITRWTPAGSEERLFLSQKSAFGAGASIRGGVPVIFPQFGDGLGNPQPGLPRHGFARRMAWALEERSAGAARFILRDDPETRLLWPHPFSCELEARLIARTLELSLCVENTGAQPFSFSAALHTYLRVSELAACWIEGLGGQPYLDTVGGRSERVQSEAALRFPAEVDRVYPAAPRRVTLREPGRGLGVECEGFPDLVVWNPGAEKSAAMADMEPDGYRFMVCIEAAVAGLPPHLLQPLERWRGVQRLSAED